jgi:hypothetical protein
VEYLRVIKTIAFSRQEFVTSAVNGSKVLILNAVVSPGIGCTALHLKVGSLCQKEM